MNKIVLLFIFIGVIVLGNVEYYFESSNLIITGLERYDQVEIVLDDFTTVLPANLVKLPWTKGKVEQIKLIPIVKNVRAEPIVLKIDGTRDSAPIFRIKIPTYLPAGKIQIEYVLLDDWDKEENITKRSFIDGKAVDVFRNGYVEIDTFFLHSGEHRLRVVIRDRAGNLTDQTYKFTVVPHIPSPPPVKSGKISSQRDHRIYSVQNSEPVIASAKGDVILKESFCFVTSIDGAGNESIPVLHYTTSNLSSFESANLISLSSCVLGGKEHTVFGRIIIPSKDTIVLKSGTSLKIPAGFSLTIRGTFIAEPGSRIYGQGQIIAADEARIALVGAKIESEILINGSNMVWISDTKIASKFTVSRSLFLALNNVSLQEASISNVRKCWINASTIENISLSGVADFLIVASKVTQRLQVTDFSNGRIYDSNLYSNDLPLIVSNFSSVETIDCWISGKRCLLTQDFSVFRARSTQFNGDNAILVSGFSVFDGFSISVTSATALTLRDSRARLFKAEMNGQILKVGRSELINLK